jgi:hypothetical protein
MIRTTLSFPALAGGFLLALAPALSWAGVIAIEPAEGNVPALLLRDAMAYTDAMHAAVIDMDRDILTDGRRKALKLTQNKVRGATLARIEYAYDVEGTLTTRVYHARSGNSLKSTIQTAGQKRGGASGSETSNGESSAADPSEVASSSTPDEIAADAAEGRFYPADTKEDVRAHKLSPDDSALDAVEIEPGKPYAHAWDAELKALRKIEADINNENVPRGGTVTGYVSKTVCESCENAIETFARQFDVDGTIYHLIEPGKIEATDERIRRSNNASRDLSQARRAYAEKQLARGNMRRPTIGEWSDLVSTPGLEAEEASAVTEHVEPCDVP